MWKREMMRNSIDRKVVLCNNVITLIKHLIKEMEKKKGEYYERKKKRRSDNRKRKKRI